MAIPQLNMDGYLLKQIKAVGNEADILSNKVFLLENGLYAQEIPTTGNGYSTFAANSSKAEKFSEWLNYNSFSNYGIITLSDIVETGVPAKYNTDTYIRHIKWTGTNFRFPFNAEFNNNKPYVAGLVFYSQTRLSGAKQMKTTISFVKQITTESARSLEVFGTGSPTISLKGGSGFCTTYACTAPFLISGKEFVFPMKVQVEAEAWGASFTDSTEISFIGQVQGTTAQETNALSVFFFAKNLD